VLLSLHRGLHLLRLLLPLRFLLRELGLVCVRWGVAGDGRVGVGVHGRVW